MKINWSEIGFKKLEEEFVYLELNFSEVLPKIALKLDSILESLKKFSEMGKPGRVFGTREIVFSGLPLAAYILVFQFHMYLYRKNIKRANEANRQHENV